MLSVIVLNYKTPELFKRCINSVKTSSYQDLDIIPIDNSENNIGPARALNKGIKQARGKYVAFLAADIIVNRYYFEHALNYLEGNSNIGAIAGKVQEMIVDYHGKSAVYIFNFKIDSVGEYLTWTGFLEQRHHGQEMNRGQFDEPCNVFSTKGTALIVRKDVLEKIGMHDKDYFMFLEDTDLCMRILLAGYKIRYIPECRLYHHIDTNKSNSRKRIAAYLGCRNYIITLIKNLSLRNLVIILPTHITLWILYGIRRGTLHYYLKAMIDILKNLRYIIYKRHQVQKLRKVSDKAYMIKFPNLRLMWKRIE